MDNHETLFMISVMLWVLFPIIAFMLLCMAILAYQILKFFYRTLRWLSNGT